MQRRRVFVKRLKEQYRDNPFYRAAFEKEFELGVTLSHPSLPRYVAARADYIVMDYVEGDTLADLIKRGDKRLKDRRFVRCLLLQLIDAVEYLHHRNVVHCDIKPDNIIVSPYTDRPATLIDLDKAYTPWLDSTPGDPLKYGCDDCADGAIDFKGISIIAAKLGFDSAAGKESADSLKRAIMPMTWAWWLVAIIAIAGATAAILLMRKDEPVVVVSQAIAVDTVPAEVAPAVAPVAPTPQKPAIDQAWITTLIKKTSAEIEGYRQTLWQTLECDTIPISDKRDAISEYTDKYCLAYSRIITSSIQHFSDISELDVQYAVRGDPEWARLEEGAIEMQRRINEWDAKLSRRSSGPLASQPDTSPNDTLPAPHR